MLPIEKHLLDGLISRCTALFRLKDSHDIEDIFPCSPMQEGILLSQAKSPASYIIDAIWKVTAKTDGEQNANLLNIGRLQAAWSEVIDRHQMFRTAVMEAGFSEATFVLVVLKRTAIPTLMAKSRTLEQFKALSEANICDDGTGLPYRISICRTDAGEVYCRLVINHALVDGWSMQDVLQDLTAAYQKNLPRGDPPPLYRDCIAYIRQRSANNEVGFWKSHLTDVKPCYFPVLGKQATGLAEQFIVEHRIKGNDVATLRQLCKQQEVTVADVFIVVWALVLRSYTGNNSICFGYITSGRDASILAVNDVLGPLINMLVHRIFFQDSSSLVSLLKEIQETYIQTLDYQHCGLHKILHIMDLKGQANFNTLVNVQRGTPSSELKDDTASGGIVFHDECHRYSTEVCCLFKSVNGRHLQVY